MQAVERAHWRSVARLLLLLFQASSTPEYKFANVFESAYTLSVDETGATTNLGSNAAGTVQSYSSPTTVIGRTSFLFEWSNFVFAGTEFMTRQVRSNPVRFGIFATESSASVTVTVDGTTVHTPTLAASTAVEVSGDYIQTDVVISSDAPILVAVANNEMEVVPLPPAAQSIYGQCSQRCQLQIWGGDTTVPIQRQCTNGSTDIVQAGEYWDGVPRYEGVSCRWTAPKGHRISGVVGADLTGWEGASFVPAEHFQLVTPVPAYMGFVVLISTGAAQCSFDSNVVTLTGANGIYHARLTEVAAATVIECDLPVTAIGDASCPAEFAATSSCSGKEMNLIAAPLTTTTTTTTTTVTSTQTATTTTSTTSMSTTTSSMSRTTTTTSSATTTTTTTATSTQTATDTTSTTSMSTTTSSMSGTTTTTSSATSTSSTTRSTTTTTTATVTATTTSSTSSSTTLTTTATTVAKTTTTTSSRTTTATMTPTMTSSSSVTETTLTFTSTAFTSTATTTSLTTTSSSTTATTTSTASTTGSNTTTSTTLSVTSTTVTDTTAASTTTTFTATSIATEAPATAFVGHVELLEASVLPAFLETNLTTLNREADGLSFVATKLGATAAAGGDLTVPLGDSKVQVTLPVSLFAFLGLNAEEGVVLTMAAVDLAGEDFVGSMGVSGEVVTAVNVNLRTLTGTRIAVVDLVDPITVSMPVNRSTGLQCVFWDEFSLGWATKGVELSSVDDGIVECKSTHLTLFAAIFRGFVNSFRCSQVTLLTAESISELGVGNWDRTPGAAVLWVLVTVFLLLLFVAAYLDWVRGRQGRTSYEHFLIPTGRMQEDARLDLLQEEEEEKGGDKDDGGVCGCVTGSTVCVAGGSWLLDACRSSGAVREALDEVCSEWVDFFGEIRDFVEGMTEGLELCSSGFGLSKFYALIHRVMCMTLAMSAQRQAAACLGISGDVSSLVMEDEDMFDVLLAHHMRKTPGLAGEDAALDSATNVESNAASNAASTPPANAASNGQLSNKEVAREDTWAQLHCEFEAKLDVFMEASASWSSLPGIVWRIYLHQNPFSACLVHCVFTSSKLRVLLFMVDVMGAIMLATVFFTAAGTPRKKSRQLECEFDNPFEFVGRILAIATSSVVIAGIPTIILGSLLTRGTKKFDYEGCPKWNRQLDIWRIQDKALWILGSSYLAFCLFFVCLFLANVDAGDHGDWLASGLISVVEEIFLIPLAIALALPLLAGASLRFMSSHMKVKKEELISERQLEFKRKGNMALPVLRV